MQEYPEQILMQGMVFHSHVGVLASEQAAGQDFEIDVTFFCRHLKACENDQLDDTINYGAAFEIIRQIVEPARFALIERLADAIATEMLAKYPLAGAVEVTVRKPHAPVSGRFSSMGVRIRRERG